MLKKTCLFVLFFIPFAIVFASESQNGAPRSDSGNAMGVPYEFNTSDITSCDDYPEDLTGGEQPQGIAHIDDQNKFWFLSTIKELKVYQGFFEPDNEKELLKSSCEVGTNCYPYANHLGDIDFDQETKTLYIPLEKLKLDKRSFKKLL